MRESADVGPFEASGLPYTSASDPIPVRPPEPPPVVQLDSELLHEIESPPPVVAFAAGTELGLAPAPSPHRLEVPPSPVIAAEPSPQRPTVPASPTVPKRHRPRWLFFAFGWLLAGSAAFAAAGGAWARSDHEPLQGSAPSPEPDTLLTLPQLRAAPPLVDAVRSRPSPPVRSASVASRARVVPAVAIQTRNPSLPPQPRASVPGGSPVGTPVQAVAGASCGERCRGNVSCLLACRPDGSGGTYGDATVLTTPTGDQIAIAMDHLRGAVMVCGLGLDSSAPERVRVRIRFASSGQPVSAIALGALAGTATAECVSRAAQRARLPPFRNASFEVDQTFAIR
jgi:hypothetical protein